MSKKPPAEPTYDPDDMGDMWREVKALSKLKRARSRNKSPEHLIAAGIEFESKNDGAHLIIVVKSQVINFWPGTGLWMLKEETRRHGGVFPLIQYVKQLKESL